MYKVLERKVEQMKQAVVYATQAAGSGHPTSCFSAAEIVATLFFHAMSYDLHDPKNIYNDRFILSKGHAAPLLYAAWWQAGVLSFEDILTLRKHNSVLEGHPTPRFSYVDVATGSLGCGLSVAVGNALAADKAGRSCYTYVLLGDSECAEGSIWEAAALASYYKVGRLIAIIDVNNLGQTGTLLDGLEHEKIVQKFAAFGWKTYCVDGHAIEQLVTTLDAACLYTQQPVVIVARTIKGNGLEDIAGKNGYHGKILDQKTTDLFLQKYTLHKEPLAWQKKEPEKTSQSLPLQKKSLPIPSYFEPCATRRVLPDALIALVKLIPQLQVLDAEVSNSTYTEIFAKQFPRQFINCFVAEQNMIGMAQGFHIQGYVPFVTTFGAFFARAYDQIRMAAISKHPLRLVGSHAGVSVGEDGPSQMALEDIALMRALPDSVVLYPCDAVSAYRCVELAAGYIDGISYVRMTREKTALVYKNNQTFTIGGSHILRKQRKAKAVIVAAGITVHEALRAQELLEKENIFVSVIDAYSIKPLDVSTILKEASVSNNTLIVVEDHYIQGGLSSVVREAFESFACYKIISLAVKHLPHSGTPQELRAWAHIDADAICGVVKAL